MLELTYPGDYRSEDDNPLDNYVKVFERVESVYQSTQSAKAVMQAYITSCLFGEYAPHAKASNVKPYFTKSFDKVFRAFKNPFEGFATAALLEIFKHRYGSFDASLTVKRSSRWDTISAGAKFDNSIFEYPFQEIQFKRTVNDITSSLESKFSELVERATNLTSAFDLLTLNTASTSFLDMSDSNPKGWRNDFDYKLVDDEEPLTVKGDMLNTPVYVFALHPHADKIIPVIYDMTGGNEDPDTPAKPYITDMVTYICEWGLHGKVDNILSGIQDESLMSEWSDVVREGIRAGLLDRIAMDLASSYRSYESNAPFSYVTPAHHFFDNNFEAIYDLIDLYAEYAKVSVLDNGFERDGDVKFLTFSQGYQNTPSVDDFAVKFVR